MPADCDAALADAYALAERLERAEWLERAMPDPAATADHDAALTLAHERAASAEVTVAVAATNRDAVRNDADAARAWLADAARGHTCA